MTRQTQQQVMELLQHFKLKTLPENGLLYSEELFKIGADDSDANLEELNQLLVQLHRQGIRPNNLVERPEGLNFLMTIAAFICDVINQRTNTETEWYNYHEAIKILPSDYGLPLDFFSSMVAMIRKQVCLPFSIIAELLHEGSDAKRTLLSYVKERCQTVSQTTRNINEWYATYIEALQHKEYIPGGNYYRQATDQIAFDFSIQSIAELDILLKCIRTEENLTEQNYSDFMQHKEKLNFLVAMSYYLGAVITRHSMSSLKWYDFEAYKQNFADDPQLSYRFELDQVAVIDSKLLFPMTIITGCLFDSSGEQPDCVEYIQNVCKDIDSAVHYFPSSLTQDFHLPLPEILDQAFTQAGFLAAYSTNMVEDTSLQPTMLVPDQGKISLVHLMYDTPQQEALSKLDSNPAGHPFQLYCEDIHAYLPTGRTDAVYLKIRVYDQHPLDLTLVIPYQKKTETQPFKIFSAVRYLPCDLPETILDTGLAQFYKQAFQFTDPISQDSLWQQYFEEKLITAPSSAEATHSHLKMIQDKFIHILKAQAEPTPQIQDQTQNSESSTFFDLNIQQLIHDLPEDFRAYLQVLPPEWMQKDELYKQIKAMPAMYKKGRVVWAALVQANKLMFEPQGPHCPGEIVFDPAGLTSPEDLIKYARQLFSLKETTPLEPDQLQYAQHISNEKTRVVNFDYPQSLCRVPLKISSIWFWRLHLPDGMLSLPCFPVLICDDEQYAGEATVLPYLFWQESFVEQWIKEGEKSHGTGYALNVTQLHARVSSNVREFGAFLRPLLSQVFDTDSAASYTAHHSQTNTPDTSSLSLVQDTPVELKIENTARNTVSITQRSVQILDNPDSSDQEKLNAVESIKTQAIYNEPEALQLMASFYEKGIHVESDSKLAFYHMAELAKTKKSETLFRNALRYYLDSENNLNHDDPEVEHWLQQLKTHYEHATRQKTAKIDPKNQSSARRKNQKQLDWTQWMIRILIGAIVLLLLIALIK